MIKKDKDTLPERGVVGEGVAAQVAVAVDATDEAGHGRQAEFLLAI